MFLVLAWTLLWSSDSTNLVGQVTDQHHQPIAGAEVFLLEANRAQTTTSEGEFTFSDIAPGTYTLRVESRNLGGTRILSVTAEAIPSNRVEIELDWDVHDEVISIGQLREQSISEQSKAATVLAERELTENLQATLGETLSEQNGVSSTYYGPASSRPILRGLGGDRVRVLESGMDSGDVSSIGPDHAVSIEPLTLTRIEILRGPTALRYGGNAVGGVVNTIDQRIPEFQTGSKLTGDFKTRFDSSNDDRGFALNLNGGQNALAWHVDYHRRDTDDLELPSDFEPIEEEEHEEEHSDMLENSSLEAAQASVGASYIRDWGFVGLSITDYDSEYGIPGHEHHHEEGGGHEGEVEVAPIVDMERMRFDVRSRIRSQTTSRHIDLRLAYVDYQHREIEGEEIATSFDNQNLEARAEMTTPAWGWFQHGSVGAQYLSRDFGAAGEEAFVAPNDTNRYGVFAVQEAQFADFNWSVGLRLERQENDGTMLEDHDHGGEAEEDDHHDSPERLSRDFDLVSISTGLVYTINDATSLALSTSRTERAPTAEELLANGPHLATQAFEVGDPDFDKEVSSNLDLSLRRTQGRVKGELNLFYNRFDRYIYEAFTGEKEDGLDLIRFAQADAEFSGAEAHLDITLLHRGPHHLALDSSIDLLQAELDDGTPLPRIPPTKTRLRLVYGHAGWQVHATMVNLGDQNDIAPFETKTAGYTMWHAGAVWNFSWKSSLHQLALRARNLTDEIGLVHTSFLKNTVPLAGRSFGLTYQLSF